MYTRAEIVDENFLLALKKDRLPKRVSHVGAGDLGLSKWQVIDLVESQFLSRHIDFAARQLRAQGKAFYTIGSAGHENNAVYGHVFPKSDVAFLHYRSGAFFIQRAKQVVELDPVRDMMLSIVAAASDPASGGRHKVFGSKLLSIPPQTSTIASHLPKAMGFALGIGKRNVLKLPPTTPTDSVVLCSFGDASLNHSTAMGALNTASWCAYQKIPLPIIFICEDNGLGISVKTPPDWVVKTQKDRPSFQYFGCDGRDLLDTYRATQTAEQFVRTYRKPTFLHMKTVRLLGHAGSDIESSYHTIADIEKAETQDPLLLSATILKDHDYLTSDDIRSLYEKSRTRVQDCLDEVTKQPRLSDANIVMESIVPKRDTYVSITPVSNARRKDVFDKEWKNVKRPNSMAKLINYALIDTMLETPEAVIFGEDVAQKGGVYHVTVDLRKRFGPSRVFNSPLDEQSILGTAIGLAQNGFLPIPEIQYLAYVHNAEDQIRGEAATLSFFSDQQFVNPMVIRIPGLAYQKGFGGHFHNDNSISVFRDIPGLIVACPSRPGDAVKMLRECTFLAREYGRVSVFLEPIALYTTKDLHKNGDGLWAEVYPPQSEKIDLGRIGVVKGESKKLIVTYGNGFYFTLQAIPEIKKKLGYDPTVIDLRWLVPLPTKELEGIVKDANQVLIVDECRQSGSLSEGLCAWMVDTFRGDMPDVKRHCALDSFIPLGPAADTLLPNRETIASIAKDFFTT